MSSTSHIVGRLRRLYGIVWGRMRFLNEGLALHRAAAQPADPVNGRRRMMEQLEPRLLLAGVSAVPGTPDLLEAYDTGVSQSDNITNITTPTIRIEASDPALAMKIYRSRVYLGDATFLSGTTFEYTFTAGQLQEGANAITARSMDGIAPSLDSETLTITLDTIVAVAAPSRVGAYDTPGRSYGVAVFGNLAYVADSASGLQIISISIPSAPTLVGTYNTPGSASDVAIVGNLAYVADGGGLQIIDVSVPSAPTLVGELITGYAYDVAVVGDLACVAGGSSGLLIIDVSTPSAPMLVGTYDTPGSALGVDVVGNLAYVADGGSGLQIISVSAPSAPMLVGTYDMPGSAYGVDAVDNLAYVAAWDAGLQIIDISTPSAPALVSDMSGYAGDVAVVGDLAYVVTSSIGLQIIDISPPSAPALVGTYDTSGYAADVAVVGNLAYVADGESGLQIIHNGAIMPDLAASSDTGPITTDNITDDTTPTFNLGSGATYARIYRDGLQVSGDFDAVPVTLPAQPYGTFAYTTQAVDAAGNVGPLSDPLTVTIVAFPPAPLLPDLLPAGDSGASNTDNITSITMPTIRIEALNPALPMKIYRSGAYLGNATLLSGTTFEYTFTAGQLQEGDNVITARNMDGIVASLDSPALTITLDTSCIWSYNTPGIALGLAVVGNLAYVADGYSGLQIIDISTPSAPVLVGTYQTTAHGVAVVGNLAYVAGGFYGLQIIDVSTPSAPALVGTYNTPGQALGVAVAGSLAYVADGDSGLRIINVSTPSAPTLVGAYDTPSFACGVAVVGNLACVADESYGLQIINISTPSSPRLVGTYDTPGFALGVAAVGSLAYVVEGFFGLRIIDMSTPSAPILVGTYDTPGLAYGVAVAGNLAYVADDSSGVQIIDVSTPSAPMLVGTYDTPGKARSVAVVGNLAYVADESAGLQIIYCGTPLLDLAPVSDTGPLSTDNITDDTTPTFDIAYAGAPYTRLYRDGILISDEYASSPVTLPLQPCGTFTYTAQAVDAAGNVGPMSNPLTVTICDPTASLTITGDGASQRWAVGRTAHVAWTSTGVVGNVDIDLSADGGTTWTTLVANTPNDGGETFTVPDMYSKMCRTRVRHHFGGSPSDISDTNFTITLPGDATEDGYVDGLDFSILLTNWHSGGHDFTAADFTGDGYVDGLDFSLLLTNWHVRATVASGADDAVEDASPGMMQVAAAPPLSFSQPAGSDVSISGRLASGPGLAAEAASPIDRAMAFGEAPSRNAPGRKSEVFGPKYLSIQPTLQPNDIEVDLLAGDCWATQATIWPQFSDSASFEAPGNEGIGIEESLSLLRGTTVVDRLSRSIHPSGHRIRCG